jgi:hypothetical protein
MRILALGALLLVGGGCATAGTEESEQWDDALRTLGNAMVQFGSQQMEAERLRQWQLQQSMPRQAICYNRGGYLSCTTY